ncbi:YecA family protein [Bermanella sp. R86510]|uniref:YecA/YgfB family protein n=1 Tax=unclassified Bermanella TaxID=2627862 RepID=UPI0037CC916C
MSTGAALNEDQLETLALFLEEQTELADGLDFFAVHGLFTANAIAREAMPWSALAPLVFASEVKWQSNKQQSEIEHLLSILQTEIIELVESGQSFPVPCDLNVEADEDGESAPLENWTMGFLLLSMENEDAWYGEHEAKAAELLFPIVYASGVNSDAPEFAEIDEDEQLSQQVCADIPDNVIDLFLLYHGEG